MNRFIITMALCGASALCAQTVDPQHGGTGTRPGTALPATCKVGQTFFKIGALAGSNMYGCTATNVWTLQTSSGGNPTALNPSGYNWTQTPGGSLGIGSNTITLTPCPAGVAGADTAHYVYLSGGTGTAEAVLITGGTCTSGAVTGTITFTTLNAHTGAWSISSAAGGSQEAVNVACAPSGIKWVQIPGGSVNVYAAITIPYSCTIAGAGNNNTFLVAQLATQDIFRVTANATGAGESPAIIRDIQFTAAASATAGAAINISAGGSLFNGFTEVSDCWFEGFFNSINAVNAAYFRIEGNKFHGGVANGNYITTQNPANSDAGDSKIENNWFFGGASGLTALRYASGGGLRVLGNKFLLNPTMINATIATASGSNQFLIENNTFDQPVVNGIILSAVDNTALFTDVVINGNYFGGLPTGSFIKWDQNGSTITRGVISANTIIQNSGTGIIFNLISGSGINLTGNNASGGNDPGTMLAIGAGMSEVAVSGNHFFYNGATNNISTSAYSIFFGANKGIDTVIPTVASAATIAIPINPVFTITGTTGVTAVTPPTASSVYRGMLTTTSGAVAFTAGASIGNSFTTTQNVPVNWFWDGNKFWLH